MKVCFLADSNLNQKIESGVLRQLPEVDFETAHEADLHGLPDDQVLALAARERRILVTQDQRTMPAHFGEFIKSNSSPGVLIIPQKRKIKRAVEGLILLYMASEAEEYVNSIRNLLT